ncbi:helix-turn-helix domain-containing protein [Virgibacillus halodenitrificans]|uniref:helix-turn-helix domain-containing protein n=1 Tax=Virgibacillus halodenitrificans TaxID=1482 RepID=UPI001F09B17C|nr:helix-turn-helix transcriptional regulator [Virgibacillus halodenitrificans]
MESILGKRLKNLREQHGYLQKFVADKIGVRSNTLSGYENGTRSPDPEMLVRLADLYKVTTDYLLGKSDDPYLTEEEAFEAFKNSPDLERWYKELPKSKEEDIRRLKRIWEAFKDDE